MEYRLVTHLGSGEVRHILESNALLIEFEKTGKRESIPLQDITQINLREELQGIFTAHIARNGGRTIRIVSRHFIGVGRFESRAAEYVAFMQQLHRDVRAANPDTRFVAGSSGLYWLGVALVVVGLLLAAAFAYGWLMMPTSPPRAMVAGVPIALVVGGMFVKQGRARSYDCDALPPKLLPPVV